MKLITTSLGDDSHCRCETCGKLIAEITNEDMIPSFEECYKAGNVAVPNLGWFCSQDCALAFEKKYAVRFMRTKEGKIDYYFDSL